MKRLAFFISTFDLMRTLILLLLISIGISSCKTEADKGKLLAKVNEAELYTADLDFLFKNEIMSKADSAEVSQSYIDNWVQKQILSQEALNNERIDQEEINRKTESFKNDLLVMEMEQLLVSERLDTAVSDKEISAYYEKHKDDFQLNDYLVKVLYIKVAVDAPDLDKVSSWYKLRKETDVAELDVYAKIYAKNYYYDEENWIYFDDLLKEIPLQDVNKDRFIMKQSKTRFEDGGYYYFLNVIDYKLKNTISPLNFEKENIRERIINVRVKELREEIKNEIISKAYEQNAVTIY